MAKPCPHVKRTTPDQLLRLACLKENFEYINFWVEHGGDKVRKASGALDQYYIEGGSPDPAEMYAKVGDALEALQNFGMGLYPFGITIPGHPELYAKSLVALDPFINEQPEKIPFDFTDLPSIVGHVNVDNRPTIHEPYGLRTCRVRLTSTHEAF
jgi:hypothetical protein